MGFLPRIDELSSPPERWEDAIVSPGSSFLVAEESGEIVGFAITRRSLDPDARTTTGELDMIFALPSVWGLGVGRILLTAAVDDLRAQGFVEATLWTAEPNRRARRAYEAAGWAADGLRRPMDYLGRRYDSLRYRIRVLEPDRFANPY